MMTGTLEAQSTGTEAIETVELDGRGGLKIGSRSYRIRDLQSIELQHSVDTGRWDVIDVYVGSTDNSGRNAFSRAALKREKIGVIAGDDVAKDIRETAAEIDLPILEY
jgi:hypothetical protein